MKNLKKLLSISFGIFGLFSLCSANSSKSFKVECNLQELKSEHFEDAHEEIVVRLQGTKNTRDLGGFKTSDGKVTKCKAFLRSDNTDKLTDEDIAKLKDEYNLKTVIDLRDNSEISLVPDKLANVEGIKYHNIALTIKKEIMQNLIAGKISKSDAYLSITSSDDALKTLKKLFETIADVDEGSILFHCTNGKDRTGLLAMYLLGLAKVKDEDIVKNYSATYELIKDSDETKKGIEKYGLSIYQSLPDDMEAVIDHIYKKHESFEKCLLSYEISQETLDKVKNKLLV